MIKGVTDRIDALDGIRGIAILLVIAVHWVHPYFPYFPGGYVGVDVFFVLSGFLITSALWRSRPLPAPTAWLRFERRRFERLYPALIVFLAIGTAVVWYFREPVTGPAAVWASLISLVQMSTFVSGSGSHALGPFGHTWSLSVEWLFYLIWPVVLIIARRRLSAGTAAIATVTLVGLMYAIATTTSAEWFYYGPVSRSAQILVGASFALFLASGRELRVPLLVGIAAAVALLAWTVLGTQEMETAYRFIGYPLATVSAVCLLATALQADRLGARLLAWSPLALVGRVSYSLYLWHVLGIQVLTPDNLPLPRILIGVVAVVVTIVLTAASYLFLERPVLMRSAKRRTRLVGELQTT